jgi:hypothetical protein
MAVTAEDTRYGLKKARNDGRISKDYSIRPAMKRVKQDSLIHTES